jgi:hypothetical protein
MKKKKALEINNFSMKLYAKSKEIKRLLANMWTKKLNGED